MPAKQDLVFDPSGDVVLLLRSSKETLSTTESDSQTTPEIEEHEALVSSRHLALASRVFRIMFDGQFKERVDLNSNEIKRVPLPDDDAHAMTILLSIIHGLNRRVPKKVSMPEFMAIAVLVDKYELHEAAEVHTNSWFDSHWSDRCVALDSSLADWVYLSWLFEKSTEFNSLTKAAIMRCAPSFNDNGRPLPETVTSKIESCRSSTIKDIFTYLQKTVNRYLTEEQQCQRDKHCDTLVLGDIIKKLKANALYPFPEAVPPHMSVAALFDKLRAIQFTSICQTKNPPHYSYASLPFSENPYRS